MDPCSPHFYLLSFKIMQGAEILYGRILRPYLLKAQNDIDSRAEQLREKVGDVASEFTKKD